MSQKSKDYDSQTISIKGMHCRSCEMLIEDNLLKVKGVNKVSVSHTKGIARIYHDRKLNTQAITAAVNSAGYDLGTDDLPILSNNLTDYIDLGWAIFIVAALYIVAKSSGLFNLTDLLSGSYSNLWLVLLVGITAGLSSCMAMVGGLVLGISAKFSEDHPHASVAEKFTPHLVFNSARVISYSLFGGIIGLAGSVIQLSPVFIGILTVLVGILMLILGGQLIDIFPILKKISFTIPKRISRLVGIKDQSHSTYTHKNAALLGSFTFFLPCGFTQAMQLYAMSSGNWLTGALTMGVFALGTSPGLLGIGGLTSALKGIWAKFFFKTAGVVVIFLALTNLSGGFILLGLNTSIQTLLGSFSKEPSVTQTPGVVDLGNLQEVYMTQNISGYSPNFFIIKKGIPVRWIINSTSAYSCASSLIAPKLGIRKNLKTGKNIIEFTPTQTGTIPFSCSMGMYSGSFKVI